MFCFFLLKYNSIVWENHASFFKGMMDVLKEMHIMVYWVGMSHHKTFCHKMLQCLEIKNWVKCDILERKPLF